MKRRPLKQQQQQKKVKIGAFFQMLSRNKGITWTKNGEKILKKFKKIKTNKKIENPSLRCTYSGVLESSCEIW